MRWGTDDMVEVFAALRRRPPQQRPAGNRDRPPTARQESLHSKKHCENTEESGRLSTWWNFEGKLKLFEEERWK